MTEAAGLSLVRGDTLFRIQRAIGLIPANGLGVGRRAVFYALVTFLPIALWAALRGRVIEGSLDEPLFEHFGVHVRCLVAIPLLILAEGVAHSVTRTVLPQFVRAGIVEDERAFRGVLEGVARLRDSTLPWVAIAGLVIGWTLLAPQSHRPHDLLWALDDPSRGSMGFGGWWYVYVARPVYVTLVLGWLWRVVLLFVLLVRLAKLDLQLVPTHPDRLAGLGFLCSLPKAFSLVVLALSAVISASWMHDVLYHGASLESLQFEAAGFLVLMLAIFLGPLLLYVPLLGRTKRRALLDYAALVGAHGRAVHARWIERKPAARDEDLLAAPEIGPVADTLAIYEAVQRMQTVPLTKASALAIVVPAVVPMLLVVLSKVPVKTLLLSVLKALT